MMASTVSNQFNLLPSYMEASATARPTKPSRRKPSLASCNANHIHIFSNNKTFGPKSCSVLAVLTRVWNNGGGGDSGGGIDANPQQKSRNMEETKHRSFKLDDTYVALFVRRLGLDNDPLDREQAMVVLWEYSLGGRNCIDNIMQFDGCINLTVNLLKSESSSACEAAAGLLRSISSINIYRDMVAESGATEAIIGLLSQPSLISEVKKQSICALWNLSVDEKHRLKIANSDVLPLLVKSLEDEDIEVKEAAGGVLANLALTHSNHNIMVEAGVIPKLAKFLDIGTEETSGAINYKNNPSKVIRREARNTLMEFTKNEYYRILIIEEGLVPVPLIGAAAYKSFTPNLRSWPRLPDDVKIEHTYKGPQGYGASKALLGLNFDKNNFKIDEGKKKAMIGWSRQHFLARAGLIEVDDPKLSQTELSAKWKFTILPWMDGVARLVLILKLEDESAIARAAESIANASINEHMRNSFKEAGAVEHLVKLLDHNNDVLRFAAIGALERLSISIGVCQKIETEGVMSPLINILKNTDASESLTEKALNLLARILDTSNEMKSKFYGGRANQSKKGFDIARGTVASIELTTNVNGMPMSKPNTKQDVLDLVVIGRLVEMLKHSSPNVQRKAASVLEFVAFIDGSMDTIISANIESGLDAVFQQKVLTETEPDVESKQVELHALQVEEAGLAISATSRLLAKLLDSKQFRHTINASHFTKLLRKILKSSIPLQYKDWVAECLAKLSSLHGPSIDSENPINMEVTLYETIPRLMEQIKSSFDPEAQEAAVVELSRIISEGVVDATRAVASQGGIFPLVRLVDSRSERAGEAALSILYNLSMDIENHSAIIAAGAVPALRRTVLAQRPQWKQALHLLRTLPT